MTYPEIEKYVLFYAEIENDRINQNFKRFLICNAESTAIANSATQSKRGHLNLKKYIEQVLNAKEVKETNDDNDFEDEFEGVNFG